MFGFVVSASANAKRLQRVEMPGAALAMPGRGWGLRPGASQ